MRLKLNMTQITISISSSPPHDELSSDPHHRMALTILAFKDSHPLPTPSFNGRQSYLEGASTTSRSPAMILLITVCWFWYPYAYGNRRRSSRRRMASFALLMYRVFRYESSSGAISFLMAWLFYLIGTNRITSRPSSSLTMFLRITSAFCSSIVGGLGSSSSMSNLF